MYGFDISTEFESCVNFCTDNPNHSDVRDAIYNLCQKVMGEYVYSKKDMIEWAHDWNMTFLSGEEVESIFEQNKEHYGKFNR